MTFQLGFHQGQAVLHLVLNYLAFGGLMGQPLKRMGQVMTECWKLTCQLSMLADAFMLKSLMMGMLTSHLIRAAVTGTYFARDFVI